MAFHQFRSRSAKIIDPGVDHQPERFYAYVGDKKELDLWPGWQCKDGTNDPSTNQSSAYKLDFLLGRQKIAERH